MPIDVSQLPLWAQKQIAEKMAKSLRESAEKSAQETPKPNRKYHNTPTEKIGADGQKLRFDSRAEARRYEELMLLLKAGEIRDLRLQQEFTLIEAYTTIDGKRVRAERYKADFTYWRGKEFVVEDVKGGNATKTKVYAVKKKQMLEKYGITITEVE